MNFTEKQVKDVIMAFCGEYGLENVLDTGIHHILLEILFPESQHELNYGAELDGFQSEYFPSPEDTEHPADKGDRLYCEECGTNFHSSNPCGDPRNEDKVVCSDCWTTIDDKLYHEEQDEIAMRKQLAELKKHNDDHILQSEIEDALGEYDNDR